MVESFLQRVSIGNDAGEPHLDQRHDRDHHEDNRPRSQPARTVVRARVLERDSIGVAHEQIGPCLPETVVSM